jgi:hypothetical protein
MQVQSSRASSVQARCPHGGSPGSCSACAGGGGGSGASKARIPGLMNWSEAFAEWNAIQVAQARQQAHLKNLSAATFLKNQEANQQLNGQPLHPTFFTNLSQSILKLLNAARGLVFGKEQTLGNEAGAISLAKPQTAKATLTFSGGIELVLNKLAAQLDDARKMIETFIHHNAELLKSMLRRLAWQQNLMVAFALSKDFLNKLKPPVILKKAFRSLLFWLGIPARLEEDRETLMTNTGKKKPLRKFF